LSAIAAPPEWLFEKPPERNPKIMLHVDRGDRGFASARRALAGRFHITADF
jgi:hypothetical protein